MKLNIRLLILFVAVYLVALVALTPLNWVQRFAEPLLRAQGIQIAETRGNLWSGRAELTVPTFDAVDFSWQTRPLGLLTARLPIDVRMSNPYLDLGGQVQLKPNGIALEGLSGHVDEPAFTRFAAAYNASLQGRLQASDVSASLGWGGALGEADGELSWSGGPVSVQIGRSNQTFQVPQMQGDISSDENAWTVNILAMDETPLINAELRRDGNGRVEVRRVLAERMDIPIPASGRATLVEMTQKVF